MQFGKVESPDRIDFTLPADHPDTHRVFAQRERSAKAGEDKLQAYVGCAQWNRNELKGFYPKGIKDELKYYAQQFNSIEMNATFYRNFPAEQYEKWREKVPEGFKFYPKIDRTISHYKRLGSDAQVHLDSFLSNAIHLERTLGTFFIQMHDNFDPKHFHRIKEFLEKWPRELKLAFELRHTDWFNTPVIAEELYALFEHYKVTTILVDTAGRRDLMHMRMTTDEPFIRYVGANDPSDYTRLDDWVARLVLWKQQGMKSFHFFIHQNKEVESTLLSAHFIKMINKALDLNLIVPKSAGREGETLSLF